MINKFELTSSKFLNLLKIFVSFVILVGTLKLSFEAANYFYFLIGFIPIEFLQLIPALTLFSVTSIIIKFQKKPISEIGLNFSKKNIHFFFLGIAISLIAVLLLFAVELIFGFVNIEIKYLSFSEIINVIYFAGIFYFSGTFIEEIIFRGIVFKDLVTETNKIFAVIFLSLIFSSSHFFNPSISIIAILNIFLAGVWLSISRIISNTLWFPISLHFGWNNFLGTILSLPVSGLSNSSWQLTNTKVIGANWFTGGQFGPEGGIVGTIFILASIALTYYLPKKYLSKIY